MKNLAVLISLSNIDIWSDEEFCFTFLSYKQRFMV